MQCCRLVKILLTPHDVAVLGFKGDLITIEQFFSSVKYLNTFNFTFPLKCIVPHCNETKHDFIPFSFYRTCKFRPQAAMIVVSQLFELAYTLPVKKLWCPIVDRHRAYMT